MKIFALAYEINPEPIDSVNFFRYIYIYLGTAIITTELKFGFASNDNNVNFSIYEDLFVKPTLDFTFRVSIPWNTPLGKITAEKINWVKNIINRIKGK